MIRVQSFAIVDVEDDPLWHAATAAIARAMDRLSSPFLGNFRPTRYRAVQEIPASNVCAIVHAASVPSDFAEHVTARANACWILASGGHSVAIPTDLPETAWIASVPDVYARTENFTDWLDAWLRRGLAIEAFASIAPELISPTALTFRAAVRKLINLVQAARAVTTGAIAASATARLEELLPWASHALQLITSDLDRRAIDDAANFFRFGTHPTHDRARVLTFLSRFPDEKIADLDSIRALDDDLALAESILGGETRTLVEQLECVIAALRRLRDDFEPTDDDSDPEWLVGSAWMSDAITRGVSGLYPPADERRWLVRNLCRPDAAQCDLGRAIADLTQLRHLSATYRERISDLLHDSRGVFGDMRGFGEAIQESPDDESFRTEARGHLYRAAEKWESLMVRTGDVFFDEETLMGFEMTEEYHRNRRRHAAFASALPEYLRDLITMPPDEIATMLPAAMALLEFLNRLLPRYGFGEMVVDLDSSLVKERA